jgi:predicted phage tail protein
MRKIILHGSLGKKFGREFELEVETAAEAVRALSVNFPEFAGAIRSGDWHVVRGETLKSGMDLDLELCSTYRLGRAPLHIVPVIAGSKRSGLMKVVIGVALIGAAFLVPGGLAAAVPFTGGMVKAGSLAMMGLAMAASGVSQMLSPEAKTDDSANNESYIFGGPGNSYAQGSPIPIVYGEVITGGVLISGGVDIEQLGN